METFLVSDSAHILSSKLFKRHFPKVSSTIRNILPKIARCGKNKIFRFEVDVMISSFPCHTAGRFHAVRNALCDLRCPASLRLSSITILFLRHDSALFVPFAKPQRCYCVASDVHWCREREGEGEGEGDITL